jgi:hypothetical protein
VTSYSDSEGKDILRTWPETSKALWSVPNAGARWLQARPKRGFAGCPDLRSVGSSALKTVPDGLWVLATQSYVDAMVVEICTSIQNLADKRSRYAPQLHALVVRLPRSWLLEALATSKHRRRWTVAFERPPETDFYLPVRHLRVLLFLDDVTYGQVRGAITPAAHEFFARHSSLKSYTAQPMQNLLRRMNADAHWYTDKKTCRFRKEWRLLIVGRQRTARPRDVCPDSVHLPSGPCLSYRYQLGGGKPRSGCAIR